MPQIIYVAGPVSSDQQRHSTKKEFHQLVKQWKESINEDDAFMCNAEFCLFEKEQAFKRRIIQLTKSEKVILLSDWFRCPDACEDKLIAEKLGLEIVFINAIKFTKKKPVDKLRFTDLMMNWKTAVDNALRPAMTNPMKYER